MIGASHLGSILPEFAPRDLPHTGRIKAIRFYWKRFSGLSFEWSTESLRHPRLWLYFLFSQTFPDPNATLPYAPETGAMPLCLNQSGTHTHIAILSLLALKGSFLAPCRAVRIKEK